VKKKGRSKLLYVLLGIFVVLLIGALLFTFKIVKLPFAESENNQMNSALKENNYQAAYTEYISSGKTESDKKVLFSHLEEYFLLCASDEYTSETWTRYRGLEIFKEDIQTYVLQHMDELVARYYGNELTEDETKTALSRVSKFSFAESKYGQCIKQIGQKDFSDKAYLEGVELYNQGKIEDAVKAFRKVSQMDSQRYPLALDALNRCKAEWGAVKIQEAQKMIDAYNKEGARDLLEKLIELFGGYEEAEKLLSTLENVVEG